MLTSTDLPRAMNYYSLFLYGMLFCPLSPQPVTTQRLLPRPLPSRVRPGEPLVVTSTSTLLPVLLSSPDPRGELQQRQSLPPPRWHTGPQPRSAPPPPQSAEPPAEGGDSAPLLSTAPPTAVGSARSCCSTSHRQAPVPQQTTRG